MLLNNFRLALRHLARHRTFSLINIGGLAISLASCIFIFYFVYDEFTYDHFHEKASRIHRLTILFKTNENTQNLLWTHQKPGPLLKRVYPQVEEFVRIEDAEAVFNKVNKEKKGIIRADASILNVFTYPLIEGNPNSALKEQQSIVISESLSKKYFHGVAIGQFVEIDGKPYTVTGVMRDVPSNSDKWVNAIAHGEFGGEEDIEDAFGYQTYILLKDSKDATFIRSKLDEVGGMMNRTNSPQLRYGFDMQALTDLHFWTGTGMDNPKGNEANTKILAGVAVVLLLVALFNFINLTTVVSLERSKEVSVRRFVGARRSELVWQFISESVVAVVIAAIGAFVMVTTMSSLFTNVSGKQISFNNKNDLLLVGIIIGLLFLAAVFSSIYPASVFSSKKVTKGNTIFRKALTALQFALSTMLVIMLTTVLYQTDFMRNGDTGFNKEKIIVLDIPGDSISKAHTNFYIDELSKVKSVIELASGGFASTPGTTDVTASPVTITVDGEKREPVISNFPADRHYTSMLGLNAIEGKSFHDFDDDQVAGKAIINQAFAKLAGWKNPVGQTIHNYGGDYEIVGIIPDFHYKSFHSKIEPLIITGQNQKVSDTRHLFLKIGSSDVDEIRATWKRLFPEQAFEYRFLNDYFDDQYKAETTLQTVFLYFTILTIIIAGSGLFGLTIHHVEKKTKEISIRKVLGAGVMSLIQLLSKEFAYLTFTGIAIGSIAGIMYARQWLNGFPYHISGGVMTFIPPVLIIIAISLAILIYKTYQGSNRNPVDGLKHE